MTTVKSKHSISQTPEMRSGSPSGNTTSVGWRIKAASGAIKTNNPIREIIETLDLAENPNKKLIPLSIGDPTVFGNLKPCNVILDALQEASNSGQYYGYQTAAGLDKAREAVAEYHRRCTGNKVKKQVSIEIIDLYRLLINTFTSQIPNRIVQIVGCDTCKWLLARYRFVYLCSSRARPKHTHSATRFSTL